MSKTDSAPTLWWVITSQINKWVVRVCLLVTAIVLVAGATVKARLDADCHDKVEWHFKLARYDLSFTAQQDQTNCYIDGSTPQG